MLVWLLCCMNFRLDCVIVSRAGKKPETHEDQVGEVHPSLTGYKTQRLNVKAETLSS